MVYHNRHECKFLVAERTAARVLALVQPFVAPDPHAATRPGHRYPIASLYLDDDAGSLLRETLDGACDRFKLRIRSYGDDPNLPVFVEVKRRHDRVVQKLRAELPRQALAAVLAGDLGDVAIVPAALPALREFTRLMLLRDARPRVTVRYEREAYVGIDDDEVRVTFDRHLAALAEDQPIVRLDSMQYHGAPPLGVVLELKFTDRFPPWLQQVVHACELRRTSFSKYGTCVALLDAAREPTRHAHA